MTTDASAADTAAGIARVLIVEDDYLACLDLEASLIEAGIEVVGIAASADRAVQLARQTQPMLIIMDVRLQGNRTGIDAALDIYAELGIRSIIASAYDDSSLRERIEPANPVGWVSKPYQTKSIIDLAKEYIQSTRPPLEMA